MYCGFYSVPVSQMDGEEFALLQKRYISAVLKELDQYNLKNGSVRTVYIGGGSPSILGIDTVSVLLDGIAGRLGEVSEFTFEANPGQIDAEYCSVLLNHGVNRLSIGVQSFNDKELRYLGRPYPPQTALEALAAARESGFSNVSIDLIFAIPQTCKEDWQAGIEKAIAAGVEHISAYSLSYDRGSRLYDRLKKGEITVIDEETDRWMYEFAIDRLQEAGYRQYEISNFAKTGFECEHNIVYWKNTGYIGIGAGAASFYNGARYHNPDNIERYLKRIESGGSGASTFRAVSGSDFASETAVLNLRLRRGVVLEEYKSLTGMDFRDLYSGRIDMHMKNGNIEQTHAGYRLTREALAVADNILCDFC
ncbi:Oxygen-independent coproporphyrinogen-III oxidase 1 [Limihaloglobus sulfuriphilus]|uniref:Heme chaperone HemW n=2 Tax=Limihaloglobus sulfuriphilus TaxID=1851148 RepID=A0A1Q2MG25_9BACT|nr:Oxygen-independent coproporphyrinogen-III oxidase 1 [Limihaloglobus sulfuriphilus]